jgi:galactonate dehydratase
MEPPITLNSLVLRTVEVSEKTCWIHLIGETHDHYSGIGEATLNSKQAKVIAAARDLPPTLSHESWRHLRTTLPWPIGEVLASALEQIALDIRGQRIGLPVASLITASPCWAIPCYANINRGTIDRTPRGFAKRAAAAATAGYKAIKLAPFDEVWPSDDEQPRRKAAIDKGLRRVASVVDTLKGKADVQIDCHSRFTLKEAAALIAALVEIGVYWIEEPVAETPEVIQRLSGLRTIVNRGNALLAGAENFTGLEGFRSIIDADAYDVIMPDIRFCGGVQETLRVGEYATARKVLVSPHNPCGPVMDATSAHMAASLPKVMSLEHQFAESPLFDDVLLSHHQIHQGHYTLQQTPGLGINWNNEFDQYTEYTILAVS